MRRIILIAILILTSFITTNAKKSDEERLNELKPIVKRFFEYLSNEQYPDISAMLDSAVKAQLDETKLVTIKSMLDFQYGKFHEIIEYKYAKYEVYDVVDIKCDYDRATIGYRFSFDSLNKIAGFVLTSKVEKDFYKPPDYVNKNSFSEKDIEFGYPGWRLKGVLTLPKDGNNFPVVVLIHGSGPNDRDETIGPNKPFRDIAWGLASKGIAVFRYDKRTLTHRDKFLNYSDSITIYDEVIDDAIKAIDTIATFPEIDKRKIYVLGHSLGGMLLPKIAREDSTIAGLIFMAAPARPLEDVYLSQLQYIFKLDGKLSKEEKEKIAEVKKQIKRVKSKNLSINTPKEELPMNTNALYWLSLRNYNQVEMAKKLNLPMLILQGHRDYQVTYDDLKLWEKAMTGRKNVEIYSYPKLNHLFMAGEGIIKPDEYNKEGHVSELIIKIISEWINKQK